MTGRDLSSSMRTLALFTWAVLAFLQPFLGLQHALAAATVLPRVPECCLGAERLDCCPDACEESSGLVLVPELPDCCKIEPPPNVPREPSPPRLAVPDPTKRALLAILHAAHSSDPITAPWVGRDPSCELLGPAPPGATGLARPSSLHWLTNRETPAALALLSVSRP